MLLIYFLFKLQGVLLDYIRMALHFTENIINEYSSIFVIRYVTVLTNFVWTVDCAERYYFQITARHRVCSVGRRYMWGISE
jgi:hypothetical protein